jgi:hypothetical protein
MKKFILCIVAFFFINLVDSQSISYPFDSCENYNSFMYSNEAISELGEYSDTIYPNGVIIFAYDPNN